MLKKLVFYPMRRFSASYLKNALYARLAIKNIFPILKNGEFSPFFDCKKIFSVLKFYYGR